MGWKLATVIARQDGVSLPAFVDEVYGTKQVLRVCGKTVDEVLSPRPGNRYACTHGGFHWLFDWALFDEALTVPVRTTRPVWTFALHSVTNAYGFSAQSGGRFLRCREGNGCDGSISRDEGTASERERALVTSFAEAGHEDEAWHAWSHAGTTFQGQGDRLTHDAIGEDVVLGLLEDCVGIRLDAASEAADSLFAAEVLEIQREPGVFERWFGWRSR